MILKLSEIQKILFELNTLLIRVLQVSTNVDVKYVTLFEIRVQV